MKITVTAIIITKVDRIVEVIILLGVESIIKLATEGVILISGVDPRGSNFICYHLDMKNLNHKEWVLEQFQNRYLKTCYRNSLLHFSIIESFIKSKSSDSFNSYSSSLKFLLCSSIITSNEFCLMDELGKPRNKLVHKVIREKLDQHQIGLIINELMTLCKRAYKEVSFIKGMLANDYGFDVNSIK